MTTSQNSFGSKKTFTHAGKTYNVYSTASIKNASRLPYSIRILLENLLRHEDGKTVTKESIQSVVDWDAKKEPDAEIAFRPARVILQDFTGVPCVADLAAMRESFASMGGDPKRINPLQPVDLVIDHSVQVDHYGTLRSFDENVKLEFERNQERYRFLKWGQSAFDGLRVVPPGTGIVHQVNVEYLADVVLGASTDTLYPDTLVGTDSHTTMINGLGVLGWGVGGIEAEAAMLGQPVAMLLPQVIGFKMTGVLPEGATATDLVLTVTEMLRKKGVVGKFVEFFGEGAKKLALTDRATIANMAPEYGATMGFFAVDEETLAYLKLTGREASHVDLVEQSLKEMGLFWEVGAPEPEFTDVLTLDLSTVVPSLAGPKRPQDRVTLTQMKPTWLKNIEGLAARSSQVTTEHGSFELKHGDVVISAITSCTNTSNPSVLIAAGLVAKRANELGIKAKPWVKTSLAPGSQVVTEYLKDAGLMSHLEAVGFHLVGYGCTTCIGNSGPLDPAISKGIKEADLVAVSVLSGNRNFEGRVSPDVKANYLASPPLCVAYAIAGTVNIDLDKDVIAKTAEGKPVYLKDIWPSAKEVADRVAKYVKTEHYKSRYAEVFKGPQAWQDTTAPVGKIYEWEKSTYIQKPPFFDGLKKETPEPPKDISGARCLALLGDSVTTDHISPAGSIKADSPAGRYLSENGVAPRDFNQYGARRGNHEVMVRGTFANIRLKNLVAPGTEGGVTRYLHQGADETMSIYDASLRYQAAGVPLLVIAGKEYGTGSSRDWAAKGTYLLGVKAVIAESFERIHRSNLVGMGVLPLEFTEGQNRASLGLTGEESFSITGITAGLSQGKLLEVKATGKQGEITFAAKARLDTPQEVEYLLHGGILQYVLRMIARGS